MHLSWRNPDVTLENGVSVDGSGYGYVPLSMTLFTCGPYRPKVP